MTQETLIARIRKLAALAQSDNVHEAAMAAEECARLMAQHQIDSACLEEGPAPVESTDLQGRTKARGVTWELSLATAISSPMCVAVHGMAGSDRIVVTGRGPDVAAMCVLYHSLKSQLVVACDRAWLALSREARDFQIAYRGGRVRFTATFMLGAAVEIKDRMLAGRVQAANDGGVTALVKMDAYAEEAKGAITRYRAEAGIKLRNSGNRVRDAGEGAYDAGRAAGRAADLAPRSRALTSGR